MESPLPDEQAATYFWTIFDANIAPMVVWDLNGRIIFANDAFLKLLGYTRQEFESQGLSWKALTPESSNEIDEKCQQELRYKGVAQPYEKNYIKKDGLLAKARVYDGIYNKTDSKGISLIVPIE